MTIGRILNIVVGTTRENRAKTVRRLLDWKAECGRNAAAVRGFTTGEPVSEGDAELYETVSEEAFERMEGDGEFVHVDRIDGTRCGYRLADIDRAIGLGDAIVVFNEFVEYVDRPMLAPLRCVKRVIDPENETQRLSAQNYTRKM